VVVAMISGCAVGPNYRRPEVDSPQVFRFATNASLTSSGLTNAALAAPELSTNSLADLPWWSVFKDPALQDLARAALTNNYDLRIALSRVDQARALQGQSQSQFLPSIGYGGESSRGRNTFLNMPNLNGGRTMSGFAGGFEAVWEVDLWGRVRRMNEAARANFMATQEGRRAVRIAVVSSVARAYFELLELDEQLAIARRTVESYQGTDKLFDDQHADGLTSRLELDRAQAALSAVSASIPETERQIALKENEINVLLGRTPGPVVRGSALSRQEMPVEIPVGLPSTLLERRPDIRMAEQAVRAANAKIGVSVGDFFPRIGLTAFFGGASTELSQLTSTSAGAWSLAASAAGPVFTGGRLVGRHREAKAACEEARLNYQEAAVKAFCEVSDALITRTKLEEAFTHQTRAVKACRDAVDTATERYRAGKASYYEVLEAQQQLFPAERMLLTMQANRKLVVVQLYRALGGGWALQDAEWSSLAAPKTPQAGTP
jgi:multidrug efflux system outer membrane protein